MKIIFILIISLYTGYANSQSIISPLPKNTNDMEIIDSGNVCVLYAFNAVDINNLSTYDDLQRLEIGGNVSKYYSYFVYQSDSLITNRKKRYNSLGIPNWMGDRGKNSNWSEYYWSEYIKDFSKNKFIEYARMPMYIKNYQYSENIPIPNWKIENDTSIVIGYLCQKATCNFRGRKYIAWFTMDIPISNGPWKFGGLPGLILKVYDEDKLYCFESIKVEFSQQKFSIKTYDYNGYIKIERKRLLKLQKEIHEDYWKVVGAISMGNQESNTERIIYKPLELE